MHPRTPGSQGRERESSVKPSKQRAKYRRPSGLTDGRTTAWSAPLSGEFDSSIGADLTDLTTSASELRNLRRAGIGSPGYRNPPSRKDMVSRWSIMTAIADLIGIDMKGIQSW